MEMWAVWLIIGVALLIVEMLSLTFYLLWLGIGALAAGIVALISPESFAAQGLTGGLIALLLTLFTKRLTRFVRTSAGWRDPVDELTGRQGILLEDVEEGKPGIVKIGGDTWSAIASEPLRKGDSVKVIHRGTTTLEVQKWGG